MSLYALTDANKKIPINLAVKGEHYRCPDCLKDVFYVAKSARATEHFAHRPGETCIEYHYTKPAPWAEQFINRFPEEYRKIPITMGDQAYIADVCIDELVLLFLSRKDESSAVGEKIDAFQSAGYKTVLIINAEADYYNAAIVQKDPATASMLKWDASPSYLKHYIPQNVKETIAVYLYLSDEKHSESGKELVHRVIWTPDSGANIWKYVMIDDHERLNITGALKAGDIFDSPFKQAWRYVESKKVRKFYELYAGEKGKGAAAAYTCPKSKDWIKPIAECKKCGHCLCIVFYSKDGKKCNKVYCAYEPDILAPIPNVKTFGHY